MIDIILGVIFFILGLLGVVNGIDSLIPKPPKGYHFVFAQDGYKIKKATLKNFCYDNNKDEEAYVLIMEKSVEKETKTN